MSTPDPSRSAQREPSSHKLGNGSRVAVIGGGPSGTFFSYFLLQMAKRVGLNLQVDIYEPRDFEKPGPSSCNHCGGVVSESLLQALAAEGIRLPSSVIQKRIDSYFLHMDVGSVRIETPLREKRIAAVHRGAGPRGVLNLKCDSFDGFLMKLALEKGANWVQARVDKVDMTNGRPTLHTRGGSEQAYDLMGVTVGVNSSGLKLFEGPEWSYRPPGKTKAYICEFSLSPEMIKRYLGSSMHVFLLNIPRLEFAAIIPKSNFVTVVLLGQDIDQDLVEAFLTSPEVTQCMPPMWKRPDNHCHCSPRLNVKSAVRPFADRAVFIGDCGTTRLFKDGIGAAYRTAKAAAKTAVFQGVSNEDFRKGYWPTCQAIRTDNGLGKLVFGVTRQIQGRRFARRGLWRMVSREQQKEGIRRRMSLVLWDTFTGSAPYRKVLLRTMHPGFFGRFIWEMVTQRKSAQLAKPRRRVPMATGATGILGKKYLDGEVIYRQGDRGDCMYVIQGGQAEVVVRKGDKEYCLAVLGDGDFFGEMGLFEEEVRSATVRAVGEVHVFTLEKQSILSRIHEDPSLAFRLLQKMSERIRDLEAKLMRQANAPA